MTARDQQKLCRSEAENEAEHPPQELTGPVLRWRRWRLTRPETCECECAGWWFGCHFFIFPYIGKNHPNWLSYFSEGLKAPTRETCECECVMCQTDLVNLTKLFGVFDPLKWSGYLIKNKLWAWFVLLALSNLVLSTGQVWSLFEVSHNLYHIFFKRPTQRVTRSNRSTQVWKSIWATCSKWTRRVGEKPSEPIHQRKWQQHDNSYPPKESKR